MPALPSDAASRLDTRYAAETPEGIALWLRPAGVVPRLYAYLLDASIRFIFFIFCYIFLALLGNLGQGLALLLFFLLEWLYPVAFELSAGAATPGKRMVDLTVVMDSGLPITPAASLTRNLLRGADFLPSLYAFGLLSMLFRHDFKRLGDIAAGTLVVHAAHADPLRGTP
ncbi:MAG: RDD family protein, partial [Pseudomonadota bacterium]|nr:RDD family protein [Pseudomonadota bacterium]